MSRDWLRERVNQLKRTASLPGGAILERGRFLAAGGFWRNAIPPLEEFIRRYPGSDRIAEARELRTRAKLEVALLRAAPDTTEQNRRDALAALESLAAEPYGFSTFAAKVAHATLQSIIVSPTDAAELMSRALTEWHQHGAALFASGPQATTLERDVMDVRDAVFHPPVNGGAYQFRELRSSDTPPPFFIVSPEVRVKLFDDSDVRVKAASRLSAQPGALMLTEGQTEVLVHILSALGGTREIQRFWNQFFTMGPGHWGGWILETFPIVTEVTFIDAARSKGASRIRIGYQGYTQLLTKDHGAWKLGDTTGHWIE